MEDTVQKILAPGRGVLALDWSPSTITKKFSEVGLDSTPELNRVYRQMLVTAPGIENYVSGVILHDETVNQNLDNGQSFVEFLDTKGILSGVRADAGSEKFTNQVEDITLGLSGLDERLKNYAQKGIKFTKWRAGFKITDLYPSKEFLEESIERLTEFALVSQRNNLVPFVEPDVEMTGNHTTTRCGETTTLILTTLFKSLSDAQVDLTKLILKTNMVLPGIASSVHAEPLEVANATLRAIRKSVPSQIGGIVFLSGGQTYEQSVYNLDKIEDLAVNDPWKISFSFARSLQADALKSWGGKVENVKPAQNVLIERLEKVSKARKGEL